jgi:hypothetical protein
MPLMMRITIEHFSNVICSFPLLFSVGFFHVVVFIAWEPPGVGCGLLDDPRVSLAHDSPTHIVQDWRFKQI